MFCKSTHIKLIVLQSLMKMVCNFWENSTGYLLYFWWPCSDIYISPNLTLTPCKAHGWLAFMFDAHTSNLCVVETEKPWAIEYKEFPYYVVRSCVYMYELLNSLSLLHVDHCHNWQNCMRLLILLNGIISYSRAFIIRDSYRGGGNLGNPPP